MKKNISIPKKNKYTEATDEYVRVTVKTQFSEPIFVDRCHTVSPNHADSQEISICFKTFNNEEFELVFTPEEWLDTFTPTMYEHVKENYIKYIKNKK